MYVVPAPNSRGLDDVPRLRHHRPRRFILIEHRRHDAVVRQHDVIKRNPGFRELSLHRLQRVRLHRDENKIKMSLLLRRQSIVGGHDDRARVARYGARGFPRLVPRARRPVRRLQRHALDLAPSKRAREVRTDASTADDEHATRRAGGARRLFARRGARVDIVVDRARHRARRAPRARRTRGDFRAREFGAKSRANGGRRREVVRVARGLASVDDYLL